MTAPARWSAWIAAPHWLGAAMVFGMLGLGFFMTRADLTAAAKFDLYQTHKTFGFLTLLLTIARLATRALVAAPASLATHSRLVAKASRAAQFALYFGMLGMGLSGWTRVSAAIVPIPIELFGLGVAPAIAPMNPELSETMARVHAALAYALATLVAVHVAAALKHHFVDRDATLRRMLGGR